MSVFFRALFVTIVLSLVSAKCAFAAKRTLIKCEHQADVHSVSFTIALDGELIVFSHIDDDFWGYVRSMAKELGIQDADDMVRVDWFRKADTCRVRASKRFDLVECWGGESMMPSYADFYSRSGKATRIYRDGGSLNASRKIIESGSGVQDEVEVGVRMCSDPGKCASIERFYYTSGCSK